VVDWRHLARAINRQTELLALRAQQLEWRLEDLAHAVEPQQKGHEANRKYFDKHCCQRLENENHVISAGDLILLHDTPSAK